MFESTALKQGCAIFVAACLLSAASSAQQPNSSAEAITSRDAAGTAYDPRALQDAFQSVIGRAAQSTVSIRARRAIAPPASLAGAAQPGVSREERLVRTSLVNGSGVVLDARGAILTNEHVIQGAGEITIINHAGDSFAARIVSADPRSDLAVLQCDGGEWQPPQWADSATLARGQWVIAIGNPFGLAGDGHASAAVGTISNLGRRLPGLGDADDRLYHDMIQVTCSIHPGNSGGPLYDLEGRLVGVVTAMHTRAPADEGIGFALPLSPAKRRVIESLMAGQSIKYGYLGLSVRPNPSAAGLIVEAVEPKGPADVAGVQVGDLVQSLNGESCGDLGRFAEQVGACRAGEMAEMAVLREGRQACCRIRVDQRQLLRVACFQGEAVLWRGARLSEFTPRTRIGLARDSACCGVVVTDVACGSSAEKSGLAAGDVIIKLGDASIACLEDFERLTRRNSAGVQLGLRDRRAVEVAP
ncbi:MAG: trypsin-like peptidase domain-containing protein [Phycisphaerales bacterium]|nr:trypsin-like peptidase domain-containing protein [Phycisphaerales bacterium]